MNDSANLTIPPPFPMAAAMSALNLAITAAANAASTAFPNWASAFSMNGWPAVRIPFAPPTPRVLLTAPPEANPGSLPRR